MKTVVITGVSTGIGYGIAKTLIKNGIQVYGSVRSAEDAKRLQKDFGALYVPLIFDITDEEKVKAAANRVREDLKNHTLYGLINNAGIAVPGPLLLLPIKDFEQQLKVNLVGQLIVTQAFVPLLGADQSLLGTPGKLINISSVAGKIPHPFLGAYSISKHGIEAFSETLRIELMTYGIDVVVIGPGAIQSEIWSKGTNAPVSDEIKQSVYQQPVSRLKDYMINTLAKHALSADVIGELVLEILRSEKPKLRYAPVPNKFQHWIIPNLLPKRFLQWMMAKQLGLLNQSTHKRN